MRADESSVDDQSVAHVNPAVRCPRKILIVRNDDDRRSITIQSLEQSDHFRAGLRIELSRRLVGEKNRRLVGESARYRDALLLPTR
jgi:hypothetical protein